MSGPRMTPTTALYDVPHSLRDAVTIAHPSWRSILLAGLEAVARADASYLPGLVQADYLPTQGRIFAAFAQPLEAVRYVLVGEGPYPRSESATGFCFMDGAVQELWSTNGLSKRVNRATSLRNFMKMLLVAEGRLSISQTTGSAMMAVGTHATTQPASTIQTLTDLQDNLHRRGFLLLNATLVYRPDVPPVRESRAWEPFLRGVLAALASHATRTGKPLPQLVLWGKIAERVISLPESAGFPQAISEHPYNLSFIGNSAMQNLFAPMTLLKKSM